MEGIKKGILKGFLELDEKLRKIPEVASGEDKSGTTAVCALISQKYLIIANCGDSRGVCCTDGKPVMATQVRFWGSKSLPKFLLFLARTISHPMSRRRNVSKTQEDRS